MALFFSGGRHKIAKLNRNKVTILVDFVFSNAPQAKWPTPPSTFGNYMMPVSTDIAVLFRHFEHDLRTRRGPSVGLFSKTSLLLWNAPLWKKSAMNKTTDYARSWKMSPLHKPISSNIRPNVNGHHFFLESMTHYIIKVGLHQLLCSSGLHRYCNACVSFTAEVVGREQWCWLSVNK